MPSVPVNDNTPLNQYTATVGQTLVPWTFWVQKATDLSVYVDGVLKTLNTDYTVDSTALANNNGGNITFLSAFAGGEEITVTRSAQIDRTTGFSESGAASFRGDTLNLEFARIIAMLQDLARDIQRCFQITPFSTYSGSLEMPEPEPLKAVIWNSDGTALTNSTYAPDDAASAATDAAAAEAAKVAAQTAQAGAETARAAAEAAASTMVAATVSEAKTGTNTTKYVTPDALAGLWEKGSDIASAGTITIPAAGGGFFHVTGTTTITNIQEATTKTGRRLVLVFDGVLTLTHSDPALILPTGANITTAVGDSAEFVCENSVSNYWRCVRYSRQSGQPLTSSYSSGDQTITSGGFLTLTHGLGATPKTIMCYLKCTTAEYNYSIGDRVLIPPFLSNNRGASVGANSTQIGIRFGSAVNSFEVLDKSTGNTQAITNANWRFVVEAYS